MPKKPTHQVRRDRVPERRVYVAPAIVEAQTFDSSLLLTCDKSDEPCENLVLAVT